MEVIATPQFSPHLGEAPRKKQKKVLSSKRKTNDLLAMAQPQPILTSFNLSSALTHFLKEKGMENGEQAPVLSQQATEEISRADDVEKQKDVTEALQKIKRLNKQFQRKQNRQNRRRSNSDSNIVVPADLMQTDPAPQLQLQVVEQPNPAVSHFNRKLRISALVNSTDQLPAQVQTVSNTPALEVAEQPIKVEYPLNTVRHFRSLSVPNLQAHYKGPPMNIMTNTGSMLKRRNCTEEERKKVSFSFTESQIFRNQEDVQEEADEMNVDRPTMDLATLAALALEKRE